MKKAQIFVISGKARSGKDTVAGDIQEYYKKQNKSCITLAYATPIKEYAKNDGVPQITAQINWCFSSFNIS